MDIQINPNPRKQTIKRKQANTDVMIQNTWILLVIAWVIYLIPIPGTSYIASVLVLGGFIMTVVTLAKGKTQQGIIQLLSIFLITPIFCFLGMIIFWTFVNKSIELNSINSKSIQNAVIKDYNREINKIKKLEHKVYQPRITKNIKKDEKKDIVYLKYIVHLKDGGKVECSKLDRKGDSIKLTSQSGLLMDVDLFKVEKIEKFETVNNKTNISSWTPGNKG
ncbi:MAG: hypothetical protein OEM02_07380 [Desulfobulbaceae bacterium]|nr:hypothetical protein [Desulfobulbaceae bacterium]